MSKLTAVPAETYLVQHYIDEQIGFLPNNSTPLLHMGEAFNDFEQFCAKVRAINAIVIFNRIYV